MNARRFLGSLSLVVRTAKSASKTTKLLSGALLLIACVGSFAACRQQSEDTESSQGELREWESRGRLPYTMHNYLK